MTELEKERKMNRELLKRWADNEDAINKKTNPKKYGGRRGETIKRKGGD